MLCVLKIDIIKNDYLMVLHFISLMHYVVMVDHGMSDEEPLYLTMFVINVLYIPTNVIND